MSNTTFTKSIYKGVKHVKHAFNLHGYTSIRAVAVATDAEQYDVQDLATAKPFNKMPKIPMVPFFGSSWVFFPFIGRYSVEKLHEADQHKYKKYGEIVYEKLGHLKLVSAYSPEAMEVVSRHESKYPNRFEFSTLKVYRESRPQWYSNSGHLGLQGKEWWDLRVKTQKHLMKPKTVQAYLDPMQDVARDLVRRIYDKRDNNKEVQGFLDDLYKWALESVAYIGLDTRMGCLDRNLAADSDGMKLIETVQTQFYCMNKLEAFTGNFQFWKYLPSPTWRKFVKASDIFTEIAIKYIDRSFEELKKRGDDDRELTMLQSMLLTKGLDASSIMVTVSDMLFAGVDTTSHSIGFLLYHLAKNPDKQKILAEEVIQLLPNKGDRITPEILNQFHYLKACMKESMRLHPIVRGNARVLDHDVVISGYRIPAETTIFCILQPVYREEKYFKNASKFLPERWINKEDKLSNFFAYVPFGVGVRSCIGRRLAELEMICLATEIIRNFNVEYHHEDIGMLTRLVNIPDKPLRFSFQDK